MSDVKPAIAETVATLLARIRVELEFGHLEQAKLLAEAVASISCYPQYTDREALAWREYAMGLETWLDDLPCTFGQGPRDRCPCTENNHVADCQLGWRKHIQIARPR